jgi:CxxC motif-containing protein (DUF1111 family)
MKGVISTFLLAGVMAAAIAGYLTTRSAPLELAGLTATVEPGEALSGGATTVVDTLIHAFGRTAMNLPRSRWDTFFKGKILFDHDWSDPTHRASVAGPRFTAAACNRCHVNDGRGAPPGPGERAATMVMQLSLNDGGGLRPEPLYGDQLNYHSADGGAPEGAVEIRYEEVSGSFADGDRYALLKPCYRFVDLGYGPLAGGSRFSPRVAPVVFGMGLLETIPERAILLRADPDDRDGDGISGRANVVRDRRRGRMMLGRFGWKANQPSLEQQALSAFASDIGVSSYLYPEQVPSMRSVSSHPGSAAELSDDDARLILFYMKLVAVPARRRVDDPLVLRGKALFGAIGCAGCHVSTMITGEAEEFPELSNQVIYPYTDLLLHDMGEELSDDRVDGLAAGSEWRTPPLWGIGLVRHVNGHTRFLHDGRARNLEEAILWHGGEGDASRGLYVRLRQKDRHALLAFLESL